jgi:hypothetical protein
MNCNGRRLVLSALLLAAIGLLWGFTAQATGSHIIGPVGGAEGACDGTDDEPDGFIDDGFHDADMAFGGGDGVADCVDAGDADGDGIIDKNENPDGIWGNADDYGDPELADTDGDGLSDGAEDANFNGNLDAGETSVTNPDTDGDGVSDGVEVGIYEFFSGGDADSDGLRDALDSDSDGDGTSDGNEDLNADGFLDTNECDPINDNTDGVSAKDLVGAEGFADTDSDGFVNCQDNNNDNDFLTDGLEDLNNDGFYNSGSECNLIDRDSDAAVIEAEDGENGNESTGNIDSDSLLDCEDPNNDNDAYTDSQEDLNDNATFESANDACNLNAANTDSQSANDGVGNEGTANTDGDGLQNCEDPDNDNDGLNDGAEDLDNSGTFNSTAECNLVNKNTDAVDGNDGDATETMADTDGDLRPNCNDTDNDNDGIVDTLDPTPNTAFDCNSAVKVKYLTSSVKFTAANQLKTVKVKITRNTGKPSVRLDSIDATATSPDIVDVTNVSPTLPKTINSSVTFTITVKGPATGPFPVTVTFPTAEFTPAFPGGVGDGQGADRLDYTFNCGTYIALGQPEQPAKLELRELRSYTYNSQLVFEALGQGVKALAVQLYDISGRGVLQAEANGSLVSVPLAGSSGKLSKGVYLAVLTVRGWDGQVIRSEIRKIVVK